MMLRLDYEKILYPLSLSTDDCKGWVKDFEKLQKIIIEENKVEALERTGMPIFSPEWLEQNASFLSF